MTRLILVRHGEAVCNVEDRWAGHDTCTGLTPHGRTQSRAAGIRVREVIGPGLDGTVIVTSVLRRALETATILAAKLDYTGSVSEICGLCERHPWDLDGITNTRAREMLAGNPAEAASAESREAFALRTRSQLRRLVAENEGRTIIAVTHTGVIAASFWIFGGLPPRLPFAVRPGNGSLTSWSRPVDRTAKWQLDRFNDAPLVLRERP